jgi:hypothetical protein
MVGDAERHSWRQLRILKANELLLSNIDDDDRPDDEGTPTKEN